MQKGISVIVKPTHDCNLGCNYCYIESGAEKGIMTDVTLSNMIEKVSNWCGKEKLIEFIWHGGEPLLMGKEFYKEAFAIEKSMDGFTFKNTLQSNGILMDEEWAKFLKANSIRVGFSLDGTRELHDKTRIFDNGLSSFSDVLRGILIAKAYDIGGGVITVVTKMNYNFLPEIYKFFKENGISSKFNPLIASGKAKLYKDNLSITPKEYGKVMTELFDLWFNESEKSIGLDPFEAIIQNLFTGRPIDCSHSQTCQMSYISVGPLGDVYPCGRFDGIKEFHFGNINDDRIEDIMNADARLKLLDRKIPECESCKYYTICYSGCPHDAYSLYNDIARKTNYCSAYKIIFEHIKHEVQKELNKAKRLSRVKKKSPRTIIRNLN